MYYCQTRIESKIEFILNGGCPRSMLEVENLCDTRIK